VMTKRDKSGTEAVTTSLRAHVFRRFSTSVSKDVRSAGSGSEVVTVVQTAESRHGNNSTPRARCCHPARRRFLIESEMRPVVVVVADVLGRQSLQVAFVKHDHMVEQITTAVPDPALGDAILPRASEARLLGLDAEVLYRAGDLFVEVLGAVEDQITRCGIVRKRLAQLLHDPCAGWTSGDIAVKNPPPVMPDDEETMEHTKGQRRDSEEVHRGNGFAVVAEECRPALRRLRTARRFPHPAQYGPLRDGEAEHLQLPVNARRAPGRVLGNDPEDEVAQFLAHALPARTISMPREPRPVQFESGAVPADYRLWLDEKQYALPSRPESPQEYPEEFIGCAQFRLRMFSAQDGELLAKRENLKKEIPPRAQIARNQTK
jgi:hypothetical protein